MFCLCLQGEGGKKETRRVERIQKGEENVFRYKSYYTVCTIVRTISGNTNIDYIFTIMIHVYYIKDKKL